jgi:hypothetical protein
LNILSNLVLFSEIRSAAGVSELEISDEQLLASGLEQELDLEMSSWMPVSESWDTVYSEGNSPTATQLQKHKLYALSLYGKYLSAYLVCQSGTMKFAKSISDSSNKIERFPWDNPSLLADLLAQANKYRRRFLLLIGEADGQFVAATFAGSSTPDFDPVTG